MHKSKADEKGSIKFSPVFYATVLYLKLNVIGRFVENDKKKSTIPPVPLVCTFPNDSFFPHL